MAVVKSIDQVLESWKDLKPYLDIYKTKAQYQEAKASLLKLMRLSKEQKTDDIISYAKALSRQIALYEESLYGKIKASPKAILRYLIEAHGLTQSDFPEIGSQSLISKILKGERELTLSHINHLSQRFNISPSCFF